MIQSLSNKMKTLVSMILVLLYQEHTLGQVFNSNLARTTTGSELSSTGSDAMDIIRKRGFFGEMFAFNASDGTLLTAYHLINPLADQRTLYKYPVIIFHGIGGNAAQMMSRSASVRPRRPTIGRINIDLVKDVNMAFFLSNNNFDVWLVDSKGSEVLQRKLANNNIDPMGHDKYWDFTLDEQTLSHFPSQVDFVLAKTLAHKAHLITYSQSTFFAFALLTTRPEFASKMASLVAIAPIAYINHLSGLGAPIADMVSRIPDGLVEVNYASPMISNTLGLSVQSMCRMPMVINACNTGMAVLLGAGNSLDTGEFYKDAIKGTSLKAYKHFAQLFTQRRIGMYDHGVHGNIKRYGSASPPDYDLGRIKFPRIILVRGVKDLVSNTDDQELFLRKLGVKPLVDIVLPNYNHLAYLTSETVAKDANHPIAVTLLDITLRLADIPDRPPNDVDMRYRYIQPMIRVPSHQVRLQQLSERKPSIGFEMKSLFENPLDIFENLRKQPEVLVDSVNRFANMVGLS